MTSPVPDPTSTEEHLIVFGVITIQVHNQTIRKNKTKTCAGPRGRVRENVSSDGGFIYIILLRRTPTTVVSQTFILYYCFRRSDVCFILFHIQRDLYSRKNTDRQWVSKMQHTVVSDRAVLVSYPGVIGRDGPHGNTNILHVKFAFNNCHRDRASYERCMENEGRQWGTINLQLVRY